MIRSTLVYLAVVWLFIMPGPAVRAEHTFDVRRNLVYAQRKTGPLGMDVYVPAGDGPFPAVLVVHGGGWTMGSRGQLGAVAIYLAQRGYTSAAISYRLAPEHPFPAQLHDCQAAVRWLRLHASELKVDPARVGGFGYSAGGHLVALLGALDDAEFREDGVPDDAPSARLQAVVAGGAPCDFRTLPANSNRLAYWLGGSRAAKPEAYRLASPAAFVTSDDPPMFFFHGAGDLLVPIRSPQRMVELLASRGVTAEMYIVDGRGHIATVFDSGALERAAVFLDSHLKTAPEAAGRAVRSVATNRRAGEGTPPQDEGRAPADFEKGGTTNGQ